MKIFTKKKICKKIFWYKKFFEKKNRKKFKKLFWQFFLYLKKNSVEIRLIFEKKKSKKC